MNRIPKFENSMMTVSQFAEYLELKIGSFDHLFPRIVNNSLTQHSKRCEVLRAIAKEIECNTLGGIFEAIKTGKISVDTIAPGVLGHGVLLDLPELRAAILVGFEQLYRQAHQTIQEIELAEARAARLLNYEDNYQRMLDALRTQDYQGLLGLL